MRSDTVGKLGTASMSFSFSGSESDEVGQWPGAGESELDEPERQHSPSSRVSGRPAAGIRAGTDTNGGVGKNVVGWSHCPHVGTGVGSEYQGPSVRRNEAEMSASPKTAGHATVVASLRPARG